MEPFSVTCTTCHARLKILDAAAIGQIHACPRCGGMVRIVAPLESSTTPEAQPSSAGAPPTEKPPATSVPQPLSLAEIASQASAVANETPAVVPAARRSFWSDPRVAWVCVPLAALVTGVVMWLTRESSTVVADVPPADVAVVDPPPVTPVDAAPAPVVSPLPGTTSGASAKPLPDATPGKAAPPSVEPPKSMEPAQASPSEKSSPDKTAPTGTPAPPTAPVKVEPPPTKPAAVPNLPAPTNAPPGAPSLLAPTKGGNSAKPEPAAPVAPAVDPVPAVQPELPKPDIAARLTNTLERIEFTNVALYDLLNFLSRATQVPIAYDYDSLAEKGVKLDQPVTVKKYNLTIGELLRGVFADLGLAWVVEDYQLRVIVADRPPAKLVALTHSTEAFTRETPEQLGDLIRSLIAPNAWVDADGRGTLQVMGQGLLVEQTPAVQRDVRRLLESLHQLRDKTYTDVPRYTRAAAKLGTPIKVNYPGPTPLTTIVEHLRKNYQLMTLVDHASLAVDGKTAQLPISLVAHEQPLGAALNAALEPQGLVLRVLDAATVEITTLAGTEAQPDLEFHPLGKFAAANASPDGILQQLTKQLPEVAWHGVGEQGRGNGTIGIDSATGTLIVRHSQVVQRRVAELLKP